MPNLVGRSQVAVLPSAVLIERSLAFAEFSLGLIAGGRQEGSAGGRGIGDVQIPDVLVVLEVGALDGGGCSVTPSSRNS